MTDDPNTSRTIEKLLGLGDPVPNGDVEVLVACGENGCGIALPRTSILSYAGQGRAHRRKRGFKDSMTHLSKAFDWTLIRLKDGMCPNPKVVGTAALGHLFEPGRLLEGIEKHIAVVVIAQAASASGDIEVTLRALPCWEDRHAR